MEPALSATPVERLVSVLDRIAVALETIAGQKHCEISEVEKVLPSRYRPHAELILSIVKKYGDDDQRVVKEFKRVALIAQSSYWKDVRFWVAVRDLIAR